MKNKKANWVVFIISFISLIVSLILFQYEGVFVDEYNTSQAIVCGGEFWLYMDWLRLGLLFVLCIILGFSLTKRSK